MRYRLALLCLPAAALLLVLSCAPVETPSTDGPGPGSPQSRKDGGRPPLPPVPDGLKTRVELALDNVKKRDLHTDYGFWTIFHGILGMGPETMLLDRKTGKRFNAIDYICAGGELPGLRFIPMKHGLDVQNGPTFVGQGHQDQFVAEMAQWGMPLDRKVVVNGKDYRFEDFVRHSEMRASTTQKQELSWAIVIVGQYRGTDVTWTNDRGEKLHFHDVVRYELDEPIDDAACGGTHRLFGLTWAYHLHLRNGGRTEGIWADVAKKIEEQKKRARKYQNPDGSFSTRYLAGPEHANDIQRQINTTGHVLEWLALAMTDAELRQPWVQEAANALALMILQSGSVPVDGGSLYHAAHGLNLYHARVFGSASGKPKDLLIPLPPGGDFVSANNSR